MNKEKSIATTGLFNKAFNIIYAIGVPAFTSICYVLFYRMCTNYNGKYKSDFSWYISLPTSDYKEKHRMVGWVLDLLYRHGIGIKGMVLYFAVIIGLLILANYCYLRFFSKDIGANTSVLQILSGLMLFSGPIYLPVLHEYYYRWSFQTFAWHSPTQQSMILFSIIAMICFIKLYEESLNGVSIKWWIATMLMVLLSAYQKPAFAIDLMLAIPVLFIVDLIITKDLSKKDSIKKMVSIGLSLVPAALYMLLVIKYNFNGSDELQRAAVEITIKHVIEYPNLLAAIICGLAFPIVVWIANGGALLKEKRYRIIFILFIVGIVQWAVFRESGVRANHGNFAWGRQVGCYLFFLTSLSIAVNNYKDKEFLKEKASVRKAYFAVLAVLLILHIVSQLHYFYLICRGYSYMR